MASVNKIGAVGQIQTSKTFKGKNDKQEVATTPQQQIIIVRQTGGVAPAVISAVVPGLGQLFDGRPGAAAGAFFGVTGVAVAALIAFAGVSAKFKNGAASIATAILGALAFGASYIGNIVNAAKGKKSQININQN